MRKPYRVAVIGPGGLGSCAIREILRQPNLQLAAVMAYSPAKQGKDAGELVGTAKTGVVVTSDLNDLLRLDLDCVLHCGRDFGDWRADNEILQLLEAGKNVITMLPYHYLKSRGADFEVRFQRAAEKGRATLHGSGITPGYFNERLVPLVTGLSNDITYIKFQEFFNAEPLGGAVETLQMFGFGSPREKAEQNVAVAMLAENYLRQPIQFFADQLGIKLDRIERKSQHQLAKLAIKTPAMTIAPGTVGTVSYAWTAYVDGKPFYTTEVYWFLGDAMRPADCVGNDFWTIAIEGRPSINVTIASMASYQDNLYIRPDEPTPPGYIMTIVAMIQAIPAVIDAAPGLLLPSLPQFHWRPSPRA